MFGSRRCYATPPGKTLRSFPPSRSAFPGAAAIFEVDPEQKLLRLEWKIDPRLCRQGENHVEIRISQRAPYRPGAEIVLEKLEIHLRYAV